MSVPRQRNVRSQVPDAQAEQARAGVEQLRQRDPAMARTLDAARRQAETYRQRNLLRRVIDSAKRIFGKKQSSGDK